MTRKPYISAFERRQARDSVPPCLMGAAISVLLGAAFAIALLYGNVKGEAAGHCIIAVLAFTLGSFYFMGAALYCAIKGRR